MSEKNPIDLYFDMKEGRIKLAAKKSEKAPALLDKYVAFLRVAYLVHQTGHWKCKSSEFYGNHLLFQRIYEDAADRTDEVAEKLIGLFGNSALDDEGQLKLMYKLNHYNSDDRIANSLEVEEDFIKLATSVYETIKENGQMTLGLDDMIMNHVNKAETAVYLLKQAKSSD